MKKTPREQDEANFREAQRSAKVLRHPIDYIKEKGFGVEIDRVRRGCCPMCGKPIRAEDFTSDGIREFQKTFTCQACQDKHVPKLPKKERV